MIDGISTASGQQTDSQARVIAHAGEDVLRLWIERVGRETQRANCSGKPVLSDFIPLLYDNIAQVAVPDMARPFGTDPKWVLADFLLPKQPTGFISADNVVKELQIFRNVIFKFARRNSLMRSEDQCEQIGYLIDATIREAIIVCTALDREVRESFIAELSHDLRNPLNIASALAQLIQRRPDNEKVAVMANRIYEKIAETDAMLQSSVATMSKK